jgi:predicted DNA-binding helix-hairpin-helix protein
MPRVFINDCSIEELMSVPGIGAKGADKILELREAKGDLELDDLNQVPYLRITQPLLDCTSFENKEGVGSLYDRHRERVRSVDKLIGKWDGTGQGQVKGRIWVHLIKSR